MIEAAREQLADLLARVRDQLSDVAEVQQKQAALRRSAKAADGAVEVMVNGQGQVVQLVIDESYLDDHDFDELGDSITEAAQAAAQDAGRQVAQMWAPINERQRSFPSLSDIVEGAPNPEDLIPRGPAGYDDGVSGTDFPAVKG